MTDRHDDSARAAGDRAEVNPGAPDDATLSALVKGVVQHWTMPPQRLGQPTWRDRVGQGRAGRPAAQRWARRFVAAAGTAAALFVALALVAVWLTVPRVNPQPSPAQGAQGSPSAHASQPTRRPTPAPAFALYGPALPAHRLILATDSGYRALDLSNGTLSAPLTDGGADLLVPVAGNRFVCLCRSQTSGTNGVITSVTITARTLDRNGAKVSEATLGTYRGSEDPSLSTEEQDSDADATSTVSEDGKTAFIGWLRREPPVWKGGVDVVDVSTGRLLQRVALPDIGTRRSNVRNYAWPPSIEIAPDAGSVVLRETEVTGANITAVHRWSANLDGAQIGALTAFPTGNGTVESDICANQLDDGFAGNRTYYVIACPNSEAIVIRRADLNGATLGDTRIPVPNGGAGPFPAVTAVDVAHQALYLWDPASRTIERVDLATGALTSGKLPDATAASDSNDALAAIGRNLGRWIAPTVAAKVFLSPGIALSPDGSRVYVLGLAGTVNGNDLFSAGSSGVWVFDAASLNLIGHWAPTSDFNSIAVSRDGLLVYAAGSTGLDNPGGSSPVGSLTVFDAASGNLRLIAGQLDDPFVHLETALVP
jgi:hypothetical protein